MHYLVELLGTGVQGLQLDVGFTQMFADKQQFKIGTPVIVK